METYLNGVRWFRQYKLKPLATSIQYTDKLENRTIHISGSIIPTSLRPHRNYGLDIGDHPHIYSYLLISNQGFMILCQAFPAKTSQNLRILVASGARALALFSPSCCAVVAFSELSAKLETRLEKSEVGDGWAAGFLPGKVTEKQWEKHFWKKSMEKPWFQWFRRFSDVEPILRKAMSNDVVACQTDAWGPGSVAATRAEAGEGGMASHERCHLDGKRWGVYMILPAKMVVLPSKNDS